VSAQVEGIAGDLHCVEKFGGNQVAPAVFGVTMHNSDGGRASRDDPRPLEEIAPISRLKNSAFIDHGQMTPTPAKAST
jgi:hypothetical protein